MNYITFKEHLFLAEARQPDVTYTEKQVKGALDRVTATLAGTRAANLSKLGSRYVRLDRSLKAMKEKHAELNERLKADVQGIFEAEDVVLTRVVETAKVTLTLAKEIQKTEKTKEVDYTAIVAALTALVPDELQAKVEEITARYTRLIDAKPPVKKLTITKSDVSEGLLDDLAAWIGRFVESIRKWGRRFDDKLDAIKRRAGIQELT